MQSHYLSTALQVAESILHHCFDFELDFCSLGGHGVLRRVKVEVEVEAEAEIWGAGIWDAGTWGGAVK